jgi:hypothetical protein
MPHAIARIAKLKSGNVGASGQHTRRAREVPNANPEITNIRFIGQPDKSENRNLETIVRERIGDQTIRKNAVLCVEMLLTASPEYFRPDDPSKAGYYEPDRLANFQQTVHSWLDNQYGERIVRAELHLDETTPHIHAYLVPLDERGKLNCRGLFGGREKLSQFQDSYAEALSPLGLERGIKGTKRNQGWFYFQQGGQSNDPIQRVVLAESPIDAMSFAVLDRNDSRRTIYLSTDGAGQIPTEFLQQSKEVVVAYDNDLPGQEMTQRVISQFPNAVCKTPSSVDWNQELVNMFDWSNKNRSHEVKQHQHGIERDTGLSW